MRGDDIPIRNVHVMLAYAFEDMRSDGVTATEGEAFEHLHDLLAAWLVRGVNEQVKRGLHRDYVRRSEPLPTVRGRIDVARTLATRSPARARLVCEFDELTADTAHNRALKSVLVLLVRHGVLERRRRDALRRLLPYLDDVTLIAPSSIRWRALDYHRANASYRRLLGICELVVRGLLSNDDRGMMQLRSWLPDEEKHRLFERFVRRYFAVHHSALRPRAHTIPWAVDAETGHGLHQLPQMMTDVTLLGPSRTVIVDAKFYGSSMQVGRGGRRSVHSGHLYQLLAYVQNHDVDRTGSVDGLLLYAHTGIDEQPDLEAIHHGNRIGARALDLRRPWAEVRAQLERVVEWVAVDHAAA